MLQMIRFMILQMYAAVEEIPASVRRFFDESPWCQYMVFGREINPALWLAAALGEPAKVRRLLMEGADIEEKGGRWELQCTPLHIAAQEGSEEVVMILLEHGADVSDKAKFRGATPLGHAIVQQYEAIVLLLLDHFADVSATDKNGRTPLHLAAFDGREALVLLLVEKGADLFSKDNTGGTPLHSAARGGRERVALLLIRHGADVTVQEQELPLCTQLHFLAKRRFFASCLRTGRK